jgi:hypothetical protein
MLFLSSLSNFENGQTHETSLYTDTDTRYSVCTSCFAAWTPPNGSQPVII